MDAVPSVAVADLPADAVLLDVREDDEWAAGHAEGAAHVPMSAFTARLDEVPDADPVYVVCRSGARSAQVAAFLQRQGRAAVNVEGGMQAWAALRRPMVGEHDGVAPVVV
jgi:rhodanese-related sulfurtransferase